MLTWQFSELLKGADSFAESFDCVDVVEQRYDIEAIDVCNVSGEISFDGLNGNLNLTIDLEASVLAANTGEAVPFVDELVMDELFTVDDEFVDEALQKIDLNGLIESLVDIMIPPYIVDENHQLTKTSGKHWQVIDEGEYTQRIQEQPEENSLSNLSSLLSEKNNK